MTGLYLDIDEYLELTEEEAVDIALRLMMPPPAEEFDWYESEINHPITDGRVLKKYRSTRP
jgi:hypothetical protein